MSASTFDTLKFVKQLQNRGQATIFPSRSVA